MQKVIKRDGRIVPFDADKIVEAIWNAAEAIGGQDRTTAEQIGARIVIIIEESFPKNHYPTVEEIQDLVEKTLIEEGHAQTAKAYILYRHQRTEARRLQEKLLGSATKVPLSLKGLEIFEKEFKKTPEELFQDIAENLSINKKEEELFYKLLSELKFLPHPFILKNAVKENSFLFHEFIIPLEPDLLTSLKNAAILMETGARITINLSQTKKPASILKLFQSAAEIYSDQTHLAVLPVDHLEKLSVLRLKDDERNLFEIFETDEDLLPESSLPATPYTPIALGWINLKTVNLNDLKETAELSALFLKRVFGKSTYPLPEITEKAEFQQFSLGLMGIAEALYHEGIPYNSYGAGVFVQNFLAKCENIPVNLIGNEIIADLFDTTDGASPFNKQSQLEKISIDQGFHSPRLMTAVNKAGSFKPFEKEIPNSIRELVTTLNDLEKTLPREHRALQKTLLHKAKKWVTT